MNPSGTTIPAPAKAQLDQKDAEITRLERELQRTIAKKNNEVDIMRKKIHALETENSKLKMRMSSNKVNKYSFQANTQAPPQAERTKRLPITPDHKAS